MSSHLPRLHVLGVPHTRTSVEFSHCAFSQKVVRLIPMMQRQGYEVWHYGVGKDCAGANSHVEIMDVGTQVDLLGYVPGADPAKFVGDDANVGHPVYRLFNERLKRALAETVVPGDLVCLPLGRGHEAGTSAHRGVNVETGIGYPETFTHFKVYESNAWYAWHMGKAGQQGHDYHWVIPNYFDAAQWPLGDDTRGYVAYFGRLIASKGIAIVREIARARPDLNVFLCGQGDPAPWLSSDVPNLRYMPPIHGMARAAYLGSAIALLTPTRYLEPFGGVTVEANLCGTPALTSAYGVFPETIVDGFTGWKCHTLGDFLAALEWAETLTPEQRARIRTQAVLKYSLDAVGPMYARAFQQIHDLSGRGWYTLRSAIGPITRAQEIAA